MSEPPPPGADDATPEPDPPILGGPPSSSRPRRASDSWTPPRAPTAPPPPTLGDARPWQPPRARGRSLRWWFAVPVALAVYLVLVLVTTVQPVSVAGLSLTVPIPGVSTPQLYALPDRPFVVAVVGVDARPGQEAGPVRTDSILLLRIDPGRNRAGIVSIPRDSMMEIPNGDGSFSQDRINTAYVYNWSPDDPNAAPRALAETVEHNLGIKIDHYIIFDQRDAAEIIDAAGGITVNAGAAFGQEDYSDDDVNVVPQFFPEGKQHLNGYSAVAYGRIREGSSDFDRIRRQQQVAEGLLEQMSSPRSVFRLRGVWNAYSDGVETDMSMRQTAGVFALLKRTGSDRLITRSLGDAAVSCDYCTASILLLNPDIAAQIIAAAFDDDAVGQQAAQLLLAAGVTP